MIVQLNPQIPVITPKGKAQAIALIDYSEEHDLHWICFLDDGGQCWTFKNSEIRGFPNATMGRTALKSDSLHQYCFGTADKAEPGQ